MGGTQDDGAVKVVTLEKAEHLLAALAPTSEYLPHRRPYSWLYRGLSRSDYQLVPTALRDGALERWGITGHSSAIARELQLLKTFFELADLRGLPLPEDSQQWRHALGSLSGVAYQYDALYASESSMSQLSLKDEWPPMYLFSLCALAQHYGLPTRLLDWTFDPLIASYFAARNAMNRHHENDLPKKMAVWAFHISFYKVPEILARHGLLELPYRLVTVPYSTNPNLAAQQGVFTVVPQLLTQKEVDRRPLNEIVYRCIAAVLDNRSLASPIFFRFELPWSEREALLLLLANWGTNASTVFPGYRGVVDAVSEKLSFWQRS